MSETEFIQMLLKLLLRYFLEIDPFFLRINGMHVVMTCNNNFQITILSEACKVMLSLTGCENIIPLMHYWIYIYIFLFLPALVCSDFQLNLSSSSYQKMLILKLLSSITNNKSSLNSMSSQNFCLNSGFQKLLEKDLCLFPPCLFLSHS